MKGSPSMRIIGGESKGRRLIRPAGAQIRPTSDMIKEALFNLLPPVEGKNVLDLFAGTGSVGLEALSRGAERVVMVEKDPHCMAVIKKNLEHCGGVDRCECLTMSAERALKILERRPEPFDIIFMDPPYDRGFVIKTLVAIEGSAILSPQGILAVQRSSREKAAARVGRFTLSDERTYGETVLSFWTSEK